eukprot:751272-Hanusia_phi.AAC.2
MLTVTVSSGDQPQWHPAAARPPPRSGPTLALGPTRGRGRARNLTLLRARRSVNDGARPDSPQAAARRGAGAAARPKPAHEPGGSAAACPVSDSPEQAQSLSAHEPRGTPESPARVRLARRAPSLQLQGFTAARRPPSRPARGRAGLADQQTSLPSSVDLTSQNPRAMLVAKCGAVARSCAMLYIRMRGGSAAASAMRRLLPQLPCSLCLLLPLSSHRTQFFVSPLLSLKSARRFSTDERRGQVAIKDDNKGLQTLTNTDERDNQSKLKAEGQGNLSTTGNDGKENHLAIKEKSKNHLFISQEDFDRYTTPTEEQQEIHHRGRFSYKSFATLFKTVEGKKKYGPVWHLYQLLLSTLPALSMWMFFEYQERRWKRKYPNLDFSTSVVTFEGKKVDDQLESVSMDVLKERELERLYSKGFITKEEFELNRLHLETVPLVPPDRIDVMENEIVQLRKEVAKVSTKSALGPGDKSSA